MTDAPRKRMRRPVLGALLHLGLGLALLGTTGWGTLALWIDGPESRALAGVLAGGYALGMLALPFVLRRDRSPFAALALFGAVAVWWLSLAPSNDRDWLEDVVRPARAEVSGDRLLFHNVRDFSYRSETDFTPRWETREYDLGKLRGMDLFMSYWGPTLIAHTILSWEFADGRQLAISIETRKERGEEYSALLGFFRQFELYYVVADERDLIGVRASQRGEDLFLYRLGDSADLARKLLLSYVERINELAAQPAWYNALTHNCTTSIRLHAERAGMLNPWDWRILVNGHADELLYERGQISNALPFAEMRAASNVTERARAGDGAADFSARIRVGLPERPASGTASP